MLGHVLFYCLLLGLCDRVVDDVCYCLISQQLAVVKGEERIPIVKSGVMWADFGRFLV